MLKDPAHKKELEITLNVLKRNIETNINDTIKLGYLFTKKELIDLIKIRVKDFKTYWVDNIKERYKQGDKYITKEDYIDARNRYLKLKQIINDLETLIFD